LDEAPWEEKLSVIVVNYNDKNNLRECLSSLGESLLEIPWEAIVVDNCSSDGSIEFIKSFFSEVKVIENKENLGFSKANNKGIEQSRAAYILFLNPDTILFPNSLSLLLKEMRSNPRAAGVGPALLDERMNYQVSFGKKVDFFPELFQKLLMNRCEKYRLRHDFGRRDVGWLSGACLLVRRRALEEAGIFDERFFLYFEDIDLCLRMRNRGWKLIYFPQARVIHKGGTSTSQLGLRRRWEYRKSQLYFYKKHNSLFSKVLLKIYLFLNFTLLYFYALLFKIEDASEIKKFFLLLKEK